MIDQETERMVAAWLRLSAALSDLNERFENKRASWAAEVAGRHIRQAQERIQPQTQMSLTQLQKRAQAAGTNGPDEWHDLPELPPHVGNYLAFWKEDGAWVAQFWPTGIEGEDGNAGKWLTTPDGSIRPDPIAWRYLPDVPDRYAALLDLDGMEAGL